MSEGEMARFTESFDSYNGVGEQVGLSSRWLIFGGSSNISLVAGRFGGNAVQLGRSSGIDNRLITSALGFTASRFRLSVAARYFAVDSGAGLSLGLGQGQTPQLGLKYSGATGIFSLMRGGSYTGNGTVLWQSEKSYPPVWRTLRLKGLVDGVEGELSLIIDNEPIIELTGINTQALGTADITHIQLIDTSVYDDLVIEDTDAEHLPECRIQQFSPIADGAHLDLTPSSGSDHYAMVDEPTVSLTDYLSGDTVGQYDELLCADLPVIPASILGVKAVGFAAKTDAASRAWNLGIDSSGTVDDGATLSLTSDPQYYENDFPLDPATGEEWTQEGINALKLRPKVAV